MNRDSNLKNSGSEGGRYEVLSVDNGSQIKLSHVVVITVIVVAVVVIWVTTALLTHGPLVAPGPSDEFMTKYGHNDQNIHSTQNNINAHPLKPD